MESTSAVEEVKMTYSEMIKKKFEIGQEVDVFCTGPWKACGTLQKVEDDCLFILNKKKEPIIINRMTVALVQPESF